MLVGGDTAETIDESDTMSRWLPIDVFLLPAWLRRLPDVHVEGATTAVRDHTPIAAN